MSLTQRSTLVVFAFLFAVGANFFAWMTWDRGRSAETRAAERTALPAMHAAQVGERCYLDGTLLPGTPLAMEFLAFERHTQRRKKYLVLGREQQALVIEGARGVVAFSNADYAFDTDHGRWWHEEKIEHAATLTENAITLKGLLPGRAVVAFGRAESAVPEGTALPPRFHADVVCAGTMESYGAELASQITWGRWPALGFLCLGIALLAIAFQQGGRLMRAP